MARLASTSLVFMLWLTPAPAWKGSTRKLSISSACRRALVLATEVAASPRTSSAAWMIASASVGQGDRLRGWRARRPS